MRFLFPAALAGALLLSSCSRKSANQTPEKSAPAAGVPVLVAKAAEQDVPVNIQAVGTVQAYSFVSIRSQITDKIVKVHFSEGQEVKEGDLLFTLDQRPAKAALNQAKANLERDKAQLVNNRLMFERTSNLFASKIASQADYDAAEANYQSAQSTVLADTAAITNAEVNLDYTTIRSPIDGRTGDLIVKEGNVVKAPDDVLVTITQTRPIYVAFATPEQYLPAIRRRAAETTLPVTTFAPGDTNHLAHGELSFIDNSVDTNTGTILLKGTFPNKDNILWPGQFVQTTLTLSNLTAATTVPSQALQTGQDGEFIFVVKPDDTVEVRTVTAGVLYNGLQVITSGLKPGETVVTDGQVRLKAGVKVSAKEAETNANSVLDASS
ncbi:MAG TPA: efflux RND transporter periplasmic adaptor subunit [Candidatus Polarisedimenticolia bacterium]|nr:efflux RND transporter periplasmic adaptor subunit [Candidatus Polarisedimenticolia bacterium]